MIFKTTFQLCEEKIHDDIIGKSRKLLLPTQTEEFDLKKVNIIAHLKI